MLARITVALIGLPIVFLLIWLGRFWIVGLAAIVLLTGVLEFYQLMQKSGHRPVIGLGLLWTVLFVLHFAQPILSPPALVSLLSLSTIITVGLIATTIYILFQRQTPLVVWAVTLSGALYIGLLGGQAVALRLLEDGFWWLIFALVVTWTNDTAAYVIGSSFGRHRPWPQLSPKKSWEGTVAGWIGAALIGGIFVYFAPLSYSVGFGIILGGLSGVLALFGDLAESLLKRQIGVKDSGKILPGHGGMLDRLDSILFVVPFIYQVVRFWGTLS